MTWRVDDSGTLGVDLGRLKTAIGYQMGEVMCENKFGKNGWRGNIGKLGHLAALNLLDLDCMLGVTVGWAGLRKHWKRCRGRVGRWRVGEEGGECCWR